MHAPTTARARAPRVCTLVPFIISSYRYSQLAVFINGSILVARKQVIIEHCSVRSIGTCKLV